MEKYSDLEKRHFAIAKAMLEADDGKVFPVDLYAVGSLKRSMAHCKGFATLMASKNLTCVGGITRMQLDTLLRFFAIFLVPEPHDFVAKVMNGKRVRDFKDRNGNKLTDVFLVSELSKKEPWIESVYKETSGYIHFSKKHIFSALDNITDETFEMFISAEDVDRVEPIYDEAIAAFIHITNTFLDYVEGWIFTKSNPKLVGTVKEAVDSFI